jgi:hypothetical protein
LSCQQCRWLRACAVASAGADRRPAFSFGGGIALLAVCASLVLDVAGIRLGPLSLGLLLGAVTALLLAGCYGRQLAADPLRQHRRAPPHGRKLAPRRLSRRRLAGIVVAHLLGVTFIWPSRNSP